MITFKSGDMLETPADIQVNTVNCVGVMGAGVALAFKIKHPEMFEKYKKDCKDGKVKPGRLHLWPSRSAENIIVNFPTKKNWKDPSEYEYIRTGLIELRSLLQEKGHVKVTLPAVGCGHGGLDWNKVKNMIGNYLEGLEADITVFEPADSKEIGKKYKEMNRKRLEKELIDQGYQVIRPDDELFPANMKNNKAFTIYVKGNLNTLKKPIISFLVSGNKNNAKSEKELKSILTLLKLLSQTDSQSEISIMAVDGNSVSRLILRKAIEYGYSTIITFPKGMIYFKVPDELKDVWDDSNACVITQADPDKSFDPSLLLNSKKLALTLSTVAIITELDDNRFSKYITKKSSQSTSLFYISYENVSPEVFKAFESRNVKPLLKSPELESLNVESLLNALGTKHKKQYRVKESKNDYKIENRISEDLQDLQNIQADFNYFSSNTNQNEDPNQELSEVSNPEVNKNQELIDQNIFDSTLKKKDKIGNINHSKYNSHKINTNQGKKMAQYPKRLIEVDLPIKKISEHARREKSIRQGHISTLHIWWARRPLAACRAVLCAALWPDPADPNCSEEFKKRASIIMKKFFDPMNVETRDFNDPLELRRALLDFISDFANWDNSVKEQFLETSKELTRLSHETFGGMPGTKPLVVDPFAGGSSIPLEALRVGADAFGSDLNPIPVILNKVSLEYIPKYGIKLAKEVDKWGRWIRNETRKELAEYYPQDSDGSIPVAYLWARNVKCEGPTCGVEIPMIRSLWLSTKRKNSAALKIITDKQKNIINFEIMENPKKQEVGKGTITRGSVTCPICGHTTPIESVRRQLRERKGGAADASLLAVVTTHPRKVGRSFRLPNEKDLKCVREASNVLSQRINRKVNDICIIPDEPLPGTSSGFISPPTYGMDNFSLLFTPRQLLSLTELVIQERRAKLIFEKELPTDLAIAVHTVLSLGISKVADIGNSLCRWKPSMSQAINLFTRQAIPILWDFVETSPFSNAAGDFNTTISNMNRIFEREAKSYVSGTAEWASADQHPLPDDSVDALFTDPPYYNAVPYADLSDFFYVWLRRCLSDTFPYLFSTKLTPKNDEICEMAGWDSVRYPEKNKDFFEQKMKISMKESRRILKTDGIGVVVFAHKSTSGWEAQLQAMIGSGWTVTGSWPIDTEMANRLRAHNSAVLASSVHLVCRPRQENNIGDWRDVINELPQRIHEWMPRLREEGVVGADAIFSCLGPALEIYSRYSTVEKASGEEVTLREYLEYVWGAVSREALNLIFEGADATGFEEDARLTAMWLWTLKTETNGHKSSKNGDEEEDEEESSPKKSGNSGLFALEYDTARKIAQGLGAHMEQMPGLVKIEGSSARLLSVEERTKYLFQSDVGKIPEGGKKGKGKGKGKQATLLNDFRSVVDQYVESGEIKVISTGKTALDRVHQAMLLFSAGRGDALKRFLVEDGVGSDDRFWRLAQALSALYPAVSNEKRWVDGVLARKKGLGF